MQFGDLWVVHVFFLVPQKLIRNIVEPIAGQFVLSVHMDQQVELNPAVSVDFEGLTHTHHFRLEFALLYFRSEVQISTKIPIVFKFERFGSFQYVLEIKVNHVVSHNKIGIVSDD